jgi:hypothetical protein
MPKEKSKRAKPRARLSAKPRGPARRPVGGKEPAALSELESIDALVYEHANLLKELRRVESALEAASKKQTLFPADDPASQPANSIPLWPRYNALDMVKLATKAIVSRTEWEEINAERLKWALKTLSEESHKNFDTASDRGIGRDSAGKKKFSWERDGRPGLGVGLDGARSVTLERSGEAVLAGAAVTPLLAPAQRRTLLAQHIEPMLRRELLHRGIISEEKGYSADLIGWVEVLSRTVARGGHEISNLKEGDAA